MINFTPEGGVGEFFGVFAPYVPPPPHGRRRSSGATRRTPRAPRRPRRVARDDARALVERSAAARASTALLQETFGPGRRRLAGEPDRVAALDRDFLEFATR